MIWPRRIIAKAKSILCYVKGKGLARTTVLSVWDGEGKDKRFHRWQQDESAARYYIDCFSEPGDIVLDPFLGGGTTAYACHHINRRYVGFEIEKEYIDITRARINGTTLIHDNVQPALFDPDSGTCSCGGTTHIVRPGKWQCDTCE